MFRGDGLGPTDGRGEKRMMGEEIDFSRESSGGLEQSLMGGGLEESEFCSRASQSVLDIRSDFVARERGQVIADDDALGHGLVHRHGKTPAQFGLAEE